MIRQATPDDSEAITRLQIAAWQSAYRGLLPDAVLTYPEADIVERIASRREKMEAKRADIREWLLEESGELLGWALAGRPRSDPDLDETTSELYALYVRPDRIGTGRGRALMDHVLTDAAACGMRELVLWVLVENDRARAFYEKAGFAEDPRAAPKAFADTGALELRLVRRL